MRAIGFLLLWAGASAVAIFVAWQGVSVVDRQVIHPPSASTEARSSSDFPAIASAAVPLEATPRIAGERPDSAASEVSDAPPQMETPFELDLSNATSRSGNTGEQTATASPSITPGRTPDAVAPATSPTSGPRTTPTVRPAPTSDEEPTARQSTPRPTQRPRPTPKPAPTATPRLTSTPAPTPSPTAAPTPTPTPDAQPQVLMFELVGGTTAISFSADTVEVLWASPAPGFSVDVSSSGPGVRVEFDHDSGVSRINAWWSTGPQWEIREDHN